jgi:hypothetical protein
MVAEEHGGGRECPRSLAVFSGPDRPGRSFGEFQARNGCDRLRWERRGEPLFEGLPEEWLQPEGIELEAEGVAMHSIHQARGLLPVEHL